MQIKGRGAHITAPAGIPREQERKMNGYRKMMIDKRESLGWCEARADDTGRVIAIHDEGALGGLSVDGIDAGYLPIAPDTLRQAAQIVAGDYYGLGDRTDTQWIMEETTHTMPCCDCPFFGVCDAMENPDDWDEDPLSDEYPDD